MVRMNHMVGGAAGGGTVGSAPCQMVWQRPKRERIQNGVKPCI
jgi:hypothetical protein